MPSWAGTIKDCCGGFLLDRPQEGTTKRPKNAAIAAAVTLTLAALLKLSPSIVSPATAQTALPAPSLNAIAGDSSIEISWKEVEDAVYYELWTWWDEGTGTPLPVEGCDECMIIDPSKVWTYNLQPGALKAFIDHYGEAPVVRDVRMAKFDPKTGLLRVGYRVQPCGADSGQYVMIWEYWKGCQCNGGIVDPSDVCGNQRDE